MFSMMRMQKDTCLVCLSPVLFETMGAGADKVRFDCPRCGAFALTGSAIAIAEPRFQLRGWRLRCITSHALRRMQRDGGPIPVVSSDLLEAIWREERLPTPREQADNAIQLAGSRQSSPDVPYALGALAFSATVGVAFSDMNDGRGWLLNHLAEEKLIEASPPSADGQLELRLTFKGWDRYEELQRTISDSRKAFMAMKYDDPSADAIFRDHFKPAVAQAGFELQRLDVRPIAGLIDHRLEVEIRASRFLVADLTHENAGAYWEAGFAAGLGKHVFYTCEKEKFSKAKTHFDTNHHFTIVWVGASPEVAANQLKDAIRATLPADAKLTDT
jgi:hypothetical protein